MLEKIKNFFRSIFSNQKYIEASKEEIETVNNLELQKNIEFKNQIVSNNQQEERILKLQKDFKAGLIKEEDLSDNDFDELSKLYEKQIEKTKQSIQRYKDRIMCVKSKLGNYGY